MIQRFLVTTADERTWPADQPILFLGEWCRLYNRKNVWQNLDAEIVPYHWDDREKFHRDYIHLQDLYEELLRDEEVVMDRLFRFLGVAPRSTTAAILKHTPDDLSSIVLNFDELCAYFRGTETERQLRERETGS